MNDSAFWEVNESFVSRLGCNEELDTGEKSVAVSQRRKVSMLSGQASLNPSGQRAALPTLSQHMATANEDLQSERERSRQGNLER